MPYAINPDDSKNAAAISSLEEKMLKFYRTAEYYFDRPEVEIESRFYSAVADLIEREELQPEHVLEVGAGVTVFPKWLKAHNIRSKITVQDITSLNVNYLEEIADEVLIGNLADFDLKEKYDLVISTFVYEHVVRPAMFLDICMDALRQGGILVIFSPKYVVPGYVPPALRHHRKIARHFATVENAFRAWTAGLRGSKGFRIVPNPAALVSDKFFRDSDAVHLVNPRDARLHLRGKARECQLRVPCLSFRDWLWQRLALNAQAFRKR